MGGEKKLESLRSDAASLAPDDHGVRSEAGRSKAARIKSAMSGSRVDKGYSTSAILAKYAAGEVRVLWDDPGLPTGDLHDPAEVPIQVGVFTIPCRRLHTRVSSTHRCAFAAPPHKS